MIFINSLKKENICNLNFKSESFIYLLLTFTNNYVFNKKWCYKLIMKLFVNTNENCFN
jgi:hypothetical protein